MFSHQRNAKVEGRVLKPKDNGASTQFGFICNLSSVAVVFQLAPTAAVVEGSPWLFRSAHDRCTFNSAGSAGLPTTAVVN